MIPEQIRLTESESIRNQNAQNIAQALKNAVDEFGSKIHLGSEEEAIAHVIELELVDITGQTFPAELCYIMPQLYSNNSEKLVRELGIILVPKGKSRLFTYKNNLNGYLRSSEIASYTWKIVIENSVSSVKITGKIETYPYFEKLGIGTALFLEAQQLLAEVATQIAKYYEKASYQVIIKDRSDDGWTSRRARQLVKRSGFESQKNQLNEDIFVKMVQVK